MEAVALDRMGAQTIFKSYISSDGRWLLKRSEVGDSWVALDERFGAFGEGKTPGEAIADLDAALEDYFETLLDCSSDELVREQVDFIVSFTDTRDLICQNPR